MRFQQIRRYLLACLAGGLVSFLVVGLPAFVQSFGAGAVGWSELGLVVRDLSVILLISLVFSLIYGAFAAAPIGLLRLMRRAIPAKSWGQASGLGAALALGPMLLASAQFRLFATPYDRFDFFMPAALVYGLCGGIAGLAWWHLGGAQAAITDG